MSYQNTLYIYQHKQAIETNVLKWSLFFCIQLYWTTFIRFLIANRPPLKIVVVGGIQAFLNADIPSCIQHIIEDNSNKPPVGKVKYFLGFSRVVTGICLRPCFRCICAECYFALKIWRLLGEQFSLKDQANQCSSSRKRQEVIWQITENFTDGWIFCRFKLLPIESLSKFWQTTGLFKEFATF